METLQDLRDRLESAERTLVETKKRVAKENAEREERRNLEARLAQIAEETRALAWSSNASNAL